MQIRKGPFQLSWDDGVSVLVLVSGFLLLCAPILTPQVRYLLVWGVGVRSAV